MRQKQQIYQVFLFCILLSLILIVISPTNPIRFASGFIEKLFSPLQKSVYSNLGLVVKDSDEELAYLKAENLQLTLLKIKLKTLEEDVQALRSQMAEINIPSEKLLDAKIIGSDAGIPGVMPSQIIINIGSGQNVKEGMAVVYKNALVGKTTKIARNRAVVMLTNNEKMSLTAKTLKTEALGIIKGDRSDMLFSDVLLTEKLEKNDLVLTRGDINIDGRGFPPDLIIGKIIAIEKKPSDLFQSARVAPFIDITELESVFVIIE